MSGGKEISAGTGLPLSFVPEQLQQLYLPLCDTLPRPKAFRNVKAHESASAPQKPGRMKGQAVEGEGDGRETMCQYCDSSYCILTTSKATAN